LRDRVRFSVLTTTADRGLPSRGEVDGIAVRRVFIDPQQPFTKLAGLARLLALAPALAREHDIFHFHGFTEKMLVLLAVARLSGRRIVQKMTSVGWDDPVAIRSRRFGRVLAAGLASADRLVSVSPAMVERSVSAGVPARKIEQIPNGVDATQFAPADPATRAALRERLGLPAGVPIVTYVGFWSREKGPGVLFEAWRLARAQTGARAALLYIGSTDSKATSCGWNVPTRSPSICARPMFSSCLRLVRECRTRCSRRWPLDWRACRRRFPASPMP
ncbi:MAG: glycosyltransferase, partial [Acidobacteria bacterium]|nr:glycosyltransferase [Acidobacteriota bacterium]